MHAPNLYNLHLYHLQIFLPERILNNECKTYSPLLCFYSKILFNYKYPSWFPLIWYMYRICNTGVAIIVIMNQLCVHTLNCFRLARYWIYLLRLMSAAYFQSVSDMSIIFNNTLITERSEGLFLASDHCFILCEQNLGLKIKYWKLIIVAYWKHFG